MFEVLVTIAIGFCILFLVETLHKRGVMRVELSRKIIHMTHGIGVATWPFFVSWHTIVVLELGFLVCVGVARWFKLFGSQHGVNRITWGEFFFLSGIILAILLGAKRWVFVLALLHLALADAAAALVGIRFGKSNGYKVFGQQKSIIGSAAFFVVSALLIAAVFIIAPSDATVISKLPLLLLPFVTTLAENLGAYGTDNLLIPLTVVLFLS